MKKLFAIIMIISTVLAAARARAQSSNLSAPTTMTTNAPAGAPAPFVALYNILPKYDPTATNTFHKGDLNVGINPMWKTATAAGSTPYLAATVDYYFAKNFGARAELVTLGNGAVQSDIDSAAVDFLARYDSGNLAVYGLAGPCHDWHTGRFGGEAGAGVEYRYTTGISAVTETKWRQLGGTANSGFLTTAGIKFALNR